MNADTLCRSARQLVALLDAGLLVVNVADDMSDTGLNAALAVVESFTAAVRGVPTADHSALIDAAPELFTDQVDNVVIWWRNKAKENAIQAGEPSDPSKPDALMLIDKQRNGEFEGKVAFWFDPESMQYLEHAGQHPRDMTSPTLWAP